MTTHLRGKVDTGAEGNILPLRTFRKMFPRYISDEGYPLKTTPSSASLTDYNSHEIAQYGTITMQCTYRDRQHWEQFFVAEATGPVIFGLQTCERLGLVQMNCAVTSHNIVIQSTQDLQQLYSDWFNGIGKFPDVHKLTIDENVTPVKHAPRRAPIQLRDNIKSELERMVNLDVIRPVETPTDWVSSITYV